MQNQNARATGARDRARVHSCTHKHTNTKCIIHFWWSRMNKRYRHVIVLRLYLMFDWFWSTNSERGVCLVHHFEFKSALGQHSRVVGIHNQHSDLKIAAQTYGHHILSISENCTTTKSSHSTAAQKNCSFTIGHERPLDERKKNYTRDSQK